MRKTRFGALAASAALASTMILGGAGVAGASLGAGSLSPETSPVAGDTDSITGGGAEVEATPYDNCEVTFEFVAPLGDDGELNDSELNLVNWVADYRVDGEEATISNEDEHLSVFNPVVASNQESVDGLNSHEKFDFDVGLLSKTVNLNDVVEANEDGEHTVTFKFYRGSADWDSDENKGEIIVTGCDTTDEGLLGSVVGSVDVFGSLEGMS